MNEIYSRLTPIFQDILDNDDIIATPELTADDVPEWDSLTHVRLVLAVQKAFSVKFSAADVSNLKNVGDLANLIEAKSTSR